MMKSQKGITRIQLMVGKKICGLMNSILIFLKKDDSIRGSAWELKKGHERT